MGIFDNLRYFFVDNYEAWSGKRDRSTPPKRLIFVGGGDFAAVGNDFLGYFISLGGLKPTDKVLDVGCGIGRMAIPLTKYLNSEGSYDGFDIVKQGIDWCRKNIQKRYKNFKFYHADIINKQYNPKGRLSAENFQFPYLSEQYSFVFLTSVFTHMLRKDLEHYAREIVRVLKNDGRALITFFLLNEESLSLMKQGKSQINFLEFDEISGGTRKDMPECVMAYDEQYIKKFFDSAGFRIIEPIHYGNWCGREKYLSFQDIVLFEKK